PIMDFFYKVSNKYSGEDTLTNINNFLLENNVDVENIEYRQDITEARTSFRRFLLFLILRFISKAIEFKTGCKFLDFTANSLLIPICKFYSKLELYLESILCTLYLSQDNETELTLTTERDEDSKIFGDTKLKQLLTKRLKDQDRVTNSSECYLNDILTIREILKREHQDTEDRFFHTIIVTGGYHTKRVTDILMQYFGYEETYKMRAPKFKNYYFIPSHCYHSDTVLTVLKLEQCFERGL
ncbi:unnamed protein product, partial [marine sediment metagenome]